MRQLLLSPIMFVYYLYFVGLSLYYWFKKELKVSNNTFFSDLIIIIFLASPSISGAANLPEALLQMMFALALYVIPCGVGLYRTRDLPTGKNKFFLALLLLPLGETLLLCIFMATTLPLS